MNNQAAQTMPTLPRPYWKAGDVKDDYGNPYNETDLFTDDDMRAMYQQGYAAALAQTAGVVEPFVHDIRCPQFNRPCECKKVAAAPAASGGEDVGRGHGNPPEEYTDWEKRVWQRGYRAGMDGQHPSLTASNPPAAASVSERARELVKRLRELSVKSHRDGQYQGYDTLRLCADELESLLSAASGEKGVG